MTHPDLSALAPRVCKCGADTGSVALDECLDCETLSGTTSDLHEITTERITVDRSEYHDLYMLWLTCMQVECELPSVVAHRSALARMVGVMQRIRAREAEARGVLSRRTARQYRDDPARREFRDVQQQPKQE